MSDQITNRARLRERHGLPGTNLQPAFQPVDNTQTKIVDATAHPDIGGAGDDFDLAAAFRSRAAANAAEPTAAE